MKPFSLQIDQAINRINNRRSRIVRAVYVKLFTAVILDTPVLEGRLRGNWQIGDQEASGTKSTKDKSGAVSIGAVNSFKLAEGQYEVFLTNNLPYAAIIEFDGHSSKAPDGMVGKNVARFERILAEAARKAA